MLTGGLRSKEGQACWRGGLLSKEAQLFGEGVVQQEGQLVGEGVVLQEGRSVEVVIAFTISAYLFDIVNVIK